MAAKYFDFEINWVGESSQEKGIDKKSGKIIFEVSKEFYRPAEVDILHGDPTLIETKLGWKRKHTFESLVLDMCENAKNYAALN